MKNTSVILAATIVMLAIATHGGEAAIFNPSPLAGPAPVANAGIGERRCEKDYKKCASLVGSLCKRLLKRGMGGGSMNNCEERKKIKKMRQPRK